MMLEIKYLAPYLPYELGLYYTDTKKIYPLVVHNSTVSMKGGFNINEVINEPMLKPILRPMSDLKKEITHKGKKLTPIYWLEEFYYTLDLHQQAESLIKEPMWLNQCDYMLIIHLIEWHFDVFGLIEKGLAVDVNTLPQTEL